MSCWPLSVPEAQAGDAGNRCVVWFRMKSDESVSSMNFDVYYPAEEGSFEGQGGDVVCQIAIPGSTLDAFRDRDLDGENILTAGVLRVNSFTGPLDLVACSWIYNSAPPSKSDFLIAVTDAALITEDFEEIDIVPVPNVRVDRVECPGQLPGDLGTTTTTTTSVGVSSTTTMLLPTTTLIATGNSCGQPTSSGRRPTSGDALFVLRAAVGLVECDVCLCDVDGSGRVASSDSLRVLQAAVGISVPLNCPPC